MNCLITPTTHNGDPFNHRVADDIFTHAKAANVTKRYIICHGIKSLPDEYAEQVNSTDPDFELENPASLLDKLLHPGKRFAAQFEKAFLLAIRSLYHSLDACRAIARPLTKHPKRDSPA